MKKVFKIILLMIVAIALLSSCAPKMKVETPRIESMFTIVEYSTTFNIVYDNKTKVMYAISKYGDGSGIFTLLVEADGSPRLWKGEGT